MKKYWNISVTHIALGTVRVMRTTGMMGEVGRAFQPVSECKAGFPARSEM
jgi:4-hydroxyphenylpyruvate dioxygenase-like putative hemolysin